MGILLGTVADDFTGATDLCNTLVRQGMRTVQLIDVPAAGLPVPDADAVTVALKSRTCPPKEAVRQSLAALEWLRRAGARQIIFKYCSTFDSTDEGNIGPVADALLEALGGDLTIACPAFPEAGRTIYKGHLFVGDLLLSDSHMRHHPLTPMTDASLVRVLGRQTPHKVGLVAYETVRQGPEAILERFAALRSEGVRHVVTDAIDEEHLFHLGAAVADLPLDHRRLGNRHGAAGELSPPRAAVRHRRGGLAAGRRGPARRCWPGPARWRRWGRSSAWRRSARRSSSSPGGWASRRPPRKRSPGPRSGSARGRC